MQRAIFVSYNVKDAANEMVNFSYVSQVCEIG